MKWDPALTDWKEFRDEWYGESRKTIPRVLQMSPFVKNLASTSILIRDCYPTMFDIVYGRAMECYGGDGVAITGQPGIGVCLLFYPFLENESYNIFAGKTLSLYYFLIRLLQLRQVILFSPKGEVVYLFYHDGVYMLPEARGSVSDILPVPKTSPGAFIWSLFDISVEAEPPSILVDWPCFPIQTASPNPSRFKVWSEARHTLQTGLPLWTKEELAEGCVFTLTARDLY